MKNPLQSPHLRLSLFVIVLLYFGLSLVAVEANRQAANQQSERNVASTIKPVAELQTAQANRVAPASTRYGIRVEVDDITNELAPLAPEQLRQVEPEQIGLNREAQINTASRSRLYRNADGSRLRVLALKSLGAEGLRIHITEFDLPAGDEVYLYGLTPDGRIAGPYTGKGPFKDGEFWADTIEGDTVIIEHFFRGREHSFTIPNLSHVFRGLKQEEAAVLIEPQVLTCHNDAMCFDDSELTDDGRTVRIRDSVGRITFNTSSGSFVCTGTLLTDRNSTFTPYFLTASHCVSTEEVARTVEFYWFYRTTSCNSGTVSSNSQHTSGATLLVTNQSADSTLLRATGNLPSGVAYSGWTGSEKSTNTSVINLSHPGGGTPNSIESYLRRAAGQIISTTISCPATGLNNGYRMSWSSGTTEPGCSGSAAWVRESNHYYLIGVDSCGPVPPGCTSQASFGKFSDFFPFIRPFIDPVACTSSPISIGQTINNSLDTGDCQSRGKLTDKYTFTGAAGQQIFISLTSSAFDAYLYLLSPSGSIIAEDDDGGGSTNARIPAGSGFISLPATGTYTIEVTSFSGSATGGYSLSLGSATSCAPSSISMGQTITGLLSATDCQSSRRGLSDRFTLVANAGQQVAITLRSSEMDTYLYLIDPNGFLLAEDDDGGGGTDSRIPSISGFLTLPISGVYTIEVTSFSGASTGSYILSLQGQAVCSYAITPTSQSFGAGGGSNSFQISTQGGCPWSVTSNANWLRVTSGSSGGGSGTVFYTVDANSDVAHSATLFIQGQSQTLTLAISQASGAAALNAAFVTQSVPMVLSTGQQFSSTLSYRNTGTQTWSGSDFYLASQNPALNRTWGGDGISLSSFTVAPGQVLTLTFTAFAPIVPGTYNFQWQMYQNNGIGFFGQPSGNVVITVRNNGPTINGASRSGKHLIVTGTNFDEGAKIMVNDVQQKTIYDSAITLIGKKIGKAMRSGDRIRIRNSNGTESNEFFYP
jgi:hypothetical protein